MSAPRKAPSKSLAALEVDPTAKCAICRNLLTDLCIECAANESESECLRTKGECDHIFHSHCMNRWLKNRSTCPLDNCEWQIAVQG
mmetsp:Transcript_18738/g.47642  ORF Transcript_18738/g.47642 Transcript_18738/m.47642 type:complete len:86 (-) Transcript_18738:478-735(-)